MLALSQAVSAIWLPNKTSKKKWCSGKVTSGNTPANKINLVNKMFLAEECCFWRGILFGIMANGYVLQQSPLFIGIDHWRMHLANGASLEKVCLIKDFVQGGNKGKNESFKEKGNCCSTAQRGMHLLLVNGKHHIQWVTEQNRNVN